MTRPLAKCPVEGGATALAHGSAWLVRKDGPRLRFYRDAREVSPERVPGDVRDELVIALGIVSSRRAS